MSASDLDGLADEQAIIVLEREFPGWMIFRSTDRLCYARRHEGSQSSVHGEDWVDLRDELIRQIWRAQN